MKGTDSGRASLEMILIAPVLLFVIMAGLQVGFIAHARNIAMGAAEEGARESARLAGGGGRGEARTFARDVSNGTLSGITVEQSRSRNQITTTVRGNVVSLVPGWNPTVVQSATYPIERFTG